MKFTAVKLFSLHFLYFLYYLIIIIFCSAARYTQINFLQCHVLLYVYNGHVYTFAINTQRPIFFLHLLIFNQKRLNVYKKGIL